MNDNKLLVVCLDDMTAYYDITDASWDKQVFMKDILLCCERKIRETFETHWKYYDESMEGKVTWVDCLSVTQKG